MFNKKGNRTSEELRYCGKKIHNKWNENKIFHDLALNKIDVALYWWMRSAIGETRCFMKAKCKEEQNHSSCLQPSSFQVPSSLRRVLPKAENTVWRMCLLYIYILLKQRKIQFVLDKDGQSCISSGSFLRPQGWKRRHEWGRWVDTLCVGGCSESTHSSCSSPDYSFILFSSSSWLYQGHYLGFINLCSSSPVFLSLVLIYHTKTYAIVWDLYVECPDMYSQKYFCLTDLNKYNSGACSSSWAFAVTFKGHQLGILFQDVAKYL